VYDTKQPLEMSSVKIASYEQSRSSSSHPRMPIGFISEQAKRSSVCVTVDQTAATMQRQRTRDKRLRRSGLISFWQLAQMSNDATDCKSPTGVEPINHEYALWRDPSWFIQCQSAARLLLAPGSLFTNTSTITFALCNHWRCIHNRSWIGSHSRSTSLHQ
jgi:hypothetical protein